MGAGRKKSAVLIHSKIAKFFADFVGVYLRKIQRGWL